MKSIKKYNCFKKFVVGIGIPILFSLTGPVAAYQASEFNDDELRISINGKWTVRISSTSSETEEFAAQELIDYFEKQSGIRLKIYDDDGSPGRCFLIGQTCLAEKEKFFEKPVKEGDDRFVIARRNDSVILVGATDRGTLYAVYDLLERLGWRWPMPSFSFCKDISEIEPISSDLYLPKNDLRNKPTFLYRGGLCVTSSWKEGPESKENLLALVDWMPKLRLNALGIHIKHWNKINPEILKEVQKRSLRLVAEGHSWSYLRGEASTGCPDPQFALDVLVEIAADFVIRHPEIDYFGPWCDDNKNWEFCPWQSEGGISRAVKFYKSLHRRLSYININKRLIIPAYQTLLHPPRKLSYPGESIIYLCPIDRDFGVPIYGEKSKKNAVYVKALTNWNNKQNSDQVVFYSYYRKHSWNSFPVNTPWKMAKELEWLATQKIRGVWNYLITEDWLSYDLQHYAYAKLCWDPSQSVEMLINEYCIALAGDQNILTLVQFHKDYERIILALDGGGFFGFSLKGMKRISGKNIHDQLIHLENIESRIESIHRNKKYGILSIRQLWCEHVQKKLHAALDLKEGKGRNAVNRYFEFLREPGRSGVIAGEIPIQINKNWPIDQF